jgi:TonB family protein
MKSVRPAAIGLLAMVIGVALAPRLRAQELAQRVEDLYASAAYEAALTAAASLNSAQATPEIEQYRVLCLVALGRMDAAERAVEQLLTRHPLYRPLAADTPPRIQELFTDVRRRLGPSVARAMYLEGKSAFDRKERAEAVRIFEELARVTDDRDLRGDPAIGEMRVLAEGFLTLSHALPSTDVEDLVEAIPAAAPITVPGSAVTAPPVATAPIPIREELPPWAPHDELGRRLEFRGAVRVSISASGTVNTADVIRSVHPAYDELLRRAAKDWTYSPARVNGVAVPSERVITVILKPRS